MENRMMGLVLEEEEGMTQFLVRMEEILVRQVVEVVQITYQ
jgi:hypothetical protein